jgi:hypothetical protein
VKPFALIVVGLTIVVLDFRLRGVDTAFDPVGWLLVAVATRELALKAAMWAAGVAAVLSISDAVLPYHYEQLHPITGERIGPANEDIADSAKALVFDSASGLRLAALAAATVTAGVALWLLVTGLCRRAQQGDADRAATHLRLLRWIVPAVWAVPYLVRVALAVAADGSFDPVWNEEMEYWVFLGLVPVAWLSWLLLSENGKAWTFPAGWAETSAWEGRERPSHPARSERHRRRGLRLSVRQPRPARRNGQRENDAVTRDSRHTTSD